MGTRAIVTKDGAPFIATHWDGYPECLGKNLLNCTNDADIVEECKNRSIDFAAVEVITALNEERIALLSAKHNLSEDEIREGKRRGNVTCSDDYEIGPIEIYEDYAEYQYDFRDGTWYCRELNGWWPDSGKTGGPFEKLSEVLNEIEDGD